MDYALINKEVLPFICTGKKVSIDYLYNCTKIQKTKIEKFLDVTDTTLPTILQAKKLAKCLRIPFAGLYMNTEDINIKSIPRIKNYRTFNGSVEIDDSGFNVAIYDVLQERSFLIEESNEIDIEISAFSAKACDSEKPDDWANMIREHFELDIQEQYKCSSSRQFFLYLKDKLERKGVFVQCFSGVPIEVVRGFSVFEPLLPIIGINEDDRPPAKAFSLIHELVHLLKRESTVCNNIINESLAQKEEIFCNSVAGEVLVPKDELIHFLKKQKYDLNYSIEKIGEIANRFSVSREVIIRRLLNCGLINKSDYEKYAEEFKHEIESDKEKQKLARMSGIKITIPRNISREAFDRTSLNVCKALYYGYVEELFNKRDIARHLGIAQKHIDKFLQEVSKWTN